MKKMLTLKNVLIWAGALLAIVAFFVAFAVTFQTGSDRGVTNIVIGKQYAYTGSVKILVEDEQTLHSTTSLIGIIFMLVAGIAAVVVSLFVKKSWAKWVVLGIGIVVLVGAILAFFVLEGVAMAEVDKAIREGEVEPSERAEAIKEEIQFFKKKGYKANAAGPVVGVIGILSACAIVVSQFVKDKALLK